MTAEVNHLLDSVIREVSNCKSEQSSLEKITTAAVTMSHLEARSYSSTG